AAEDAAFIGNVDDLSLLRLDVNAAIAAGEIEFAVRSPAQAVEVVAEERVADAVAGRKNLFDVGDAVVVRVAEKPQVRAVRHVDIITARDDPGADAAQRLLPFVKAARMIGLPVAVAVFDQAESIGPDGELGIVAVVPLVQRRLALFDGSR